MHLYWRRAISGTPASDPSPHLISITEGGVVLLLGDFAGLSQKSIAAVLKLETERTNAMTKLGFMS